MHERVSANALCFMGESLEAMMGHWRELKPRRIGAGSALLMGHPDTRRMLAGTDYILESVVHPFAQGELSDRSAFEPARQKLNEAIDFLGTLGAKNIYMLTGGRGDLTWEQAAEAFAEAVAPCVPRARDAGIRLLVEPAGAFYADHHIAHNLRDTVQLAEIADVGVCLDVFPVWTEAGLKETIARAGPRLGLVQVGDYVLGDRAMPCRAVVGEGAIPIDRIVGWILETGYEGAFDLELLGPRIDAYGRLEAARVSAERLGAMIDAHGG